MIIVENEEIWGFEHAIRGMRNPMNSWDKSDTICGEYHGLDENGNEILAPYKIPKIGNNDLTLMQKLYEGGQPHRKYLRQIFVSMDITAPLYWWKEADTYKVGTTANSCSTMHKITAKRFSVGDFSYENLITSGDEDVVDALGESIKGIDDEICNMNGMKSLLITVRLLNAYREKFLKTKDKKYWWQIIQLLPSSYNQKRTVTMTYENVMNILDYRQGHKLDEWNEFCNILLELPYVAEIRNS